MMHETPSRQLHQSPYVEHPQEHLAFAQTLLEEHGVLRYRNHDDFLQMLNIMQGHRLTMQAVIATLNDHTPSEVLERVRSRDDDGASAMILRASVEMLYHDDTASIRPFYLCLAPFRSSVNRVALKPYVDAVAKLPLMRGVDASRWEDYLSKAEQAGVLGPVTDNAPLIRLHEAFTFLLHRRWQADVSDEEKQAITKAHMEHLRHLMPTYQSLMESDDEKEQQFGLMVCQQELENVHAALETGLTRRDDILPFVKYLMAFFDDVGERETALHVAEDVLKKLEQYDDDALDGHAGAGYIAVMHTIADRYAGTPQYPRSRELYDRILKHYDRLTTVTPHGRMRGRATIYDDLGQLALHQQDWDDAATQFKKALALKRECADQMGELSTLVHLGRMAHHVKRWEEANVYYPQALKIAVGLKLDEKRGDIYQEWGEVAFDAGEWINAEHRFKAALEAHVHAEDRHAQAAAWHLLGKAAQAQNSLDRALHCYQEALALFSEQEDHHGKAVTTHQLGVVAMEYEQYTASRTWLLAALEHFKGLEDGDGIQFTLSNMARLASRSGNGDILAEAGTMLGVSEQDLVRWLQSQ